MIIILNEISGVTSSMPDDIMNSLLLILESSLLHTCPVSFGWQIKSCCSFLLKKIVIIFSVQMDSAPTVIIILNTLQSATKLAEPLFRPCLKMNLKIYHTSKYNITIPLPAFNAAHAQKSDSSLQGRVVQNKNYSEML